MVFGASGRRCNVGANLLPPFNTSLNPCIPIECSNVYPNPQISGIGKFPYLSVEQAGVDFGAVVVGQRVERLVRFGNHSVVPAHFAVTHDQAGPDDGVFTVGPARCVHVLTKTKQTGRSPPQRCA